MVGNVDPSWLYLVNRGSGEAGIPGDLGVPGTSAVP